jgi:hypothetical protein
VTTERYPFVKCLARGGCLFFNSYLRLGENLTLMVGSEIFLSRKTFLFGANAPP